MSHIIPINHFHKESFSNRWISFRESESLKKIQFSFNGRDFFELPFSDLMRYHNNISLWGGNVTWRGIHEDSNQPKLKLSLVKILYVFRNFHAMKHVIDKTNVRIEKHNERMIEKMHPLTYIVAKAILAVTSFFNFVSFKLIPVVNLIERWKIPTHKPLMYPQLPQQGMDIDWVVHEMRTYCPEFYASIKVSEKPLETVLGEFCQNPQGQLDDYLQLTNGETFDQLYEQDCNGYLWMLGEQMDQYRNDPHSLLKKPPGL